MHCDIKTFAQLATAELYALLALRSRVFVVEQNCVYADPDGANDFRALHLLCWQGPELAAYARLLPPSEAGAAVAIGRVVVAPARRGCGLARRLMQQALAECRQRWPQARVYVQAQQYLQPFYASLGFAADSAVYLEDGIPHVDMYRAADAAGLPENATI